MSLPPPSQTVMKILLAAGSRLPDAIDEFLPGVGVPFVDGVAAIVIEVRAVHVLYGGDVIHHQCLRITPRFVGVALTRRAPT